MSSVRQSARTSERQRIVALARELDESSSNSEQRDFPHLPEAGGKELRIRHKKKTYTEMSSAEIDAEAIRTDRMLDLAELKQRMAEAAEDEEYAHQLNDDVADELMQDEQAETQEQTDGQTRRSSRTHHPRRHFDDVDEDEGDAGNAAMEIEDEPEEEAADEEEEEEEYIPEEEDASFSRAHLSRSAKTVSAERQQKAAADRDRPRGRPFEGTILGQIINCIKELDLNRTRDGFTIQKVRVHLQKQDPSLSTRMINTAWDKGINEKLLYNPRDDLKRYKLDHVRLNDIYAERSKSKAAAYVSKKRSGGFPESGDDEDIIAKNPSAARASAAMEKTPVFVDPTIALLKHLTDSMSPWRNQVLAAQKRSVSRSSADMSVSPAAINTSTLMQNGLTSAEATSIQFPNRRASRRVNRFEQSVERETIDCISADDEGERYPSQKEERKEERKEDRREVKRESARSFDDIAMSDADGMSLAEGKNVNMPSSSPAKFGLLMPASSTAAAAAFGEMDSMDASMKVEENHKSDEAQAEREFLRLRGPEILSDWTLFTILRAPHHKMNLEQLQVAVTRVQHLPQTFIKWALRPSTPVPSLPSPSSYEDESKHPPSASTTSYTPLQSVLHDLCTQQMLVCTSMRHGEYKATQVALDSCKTAVPVLKGEGSGAVASSSSSSRGRTRNTVQAAHTAELRALKVMLSVAQSRFIAHHKGVFQPFITSAKVRAAHGMPKYVETLEEGQKLVSAKMEYQIYPVPEAIQQRELVKEYQKKGFSFMAHMHDSGSSAILADEMGLGKTLQTICFLAWLKENRGLNGPHLVIVPLNVLDTWVGEIQRWCPSMRPVRYYGSERERKRILDEYLQFGTFDVIVTTYETVVACENFFKFRFFFCYTIVDEAHRIKNESSLLSIALRHVPSVNKILLTGTPLQNNLHELWALLNFLFPQLFPTSEPFDSGFDLHQGIVNPTVLLAAQAMLQVVMIRRLKREVATKLPIKTETQIKCRLAPYQTHWYKLLLLSNSGLLDKMADEARAKTSNESLLNDNDDGDLNAGDAQVLHERAELDEEGNIRAEQRARLMRETPTLSNATIAAAASVAKREDEVFGDATITAAASGEWRKLLNLMMQMRKVCNHPYILKDAVPHDAPRDSIIKDSGKMQMLEKLLPKLKAGGHRVLIFSAFLGMLDILGSFCELKKYKFLRLDGSTNRVQRKFDMWRFNAPDSPFFIYLISTRAGGLGINLATADTVIHYDSDWNPQADLQAQDRAHRIGQTKPVRVFRLVCGSTVEERVVERAQRKLYLDAMVTSGQAGLQQGQADQLTKAQLLSMLKFGSDAIFSSRGEIDDRDIDAILSGAQTKLMTDEAIEADAKAVVVAAKQDCQNFDASIPVAKFLDDAYASEGIDPKNISYRSIADSWNNMTGKRERQSTTVMIGHDAVLRKNNYNMGDDLGREKTERDIHFVNVAYKPFIDWQEWCNVCHDGGEVVICNRCPRSFHRECINFVPGYSGNYLCPQHRCHVCDRGATDAGMLFACTSCDKAWCEDHTPKDILPVRNDARLQQLGYFNKKGVYYVVCDQKDCMDYYLEYVKPIEVKLENAAAGEIDNEEETGLSSLDNLLNVTSASAEPVSADTSAAAGAASSSLPTKSRPASSPTRASIRRRNVKSTPSSSSSSAPVSSNDTAYAKLPDRLRGRIKKILAREVEAAEEGEDQNSLSDIAEIAETFRYVHDGSTLLQALHAMLYGEESDRMSDAKWKLMAWKGLKPHISKFEAGDFYARCMDEFKGWKTSSIEELSKMLHLGTQTPPVLIKAGPNKGKMSNTDFRNFSVNKGTLDEETGIRGDPEECVLEHMICFFIAPRPYSLQLRYEYMKSSVLKDRKYWEEIRIEQETGIPRPKKPKHEKGKEDTEEDRKTKKEKSAEKSAEKAKNKPKSDSTSGKKDSASKSKSDGSKKNNSTSAKDNLKKDQKPVKSAGPTGGNTSNSKDKSPKKVTLKQTPKKDDSAKKRSRSKSPPREASPSKKKVKLEAHNNSSSTPVRPVSVISVHSSSSPPALTPVPVSSLSSFLSPACMRQSVPSSAATTFRSPSAVLDAPKISSPPPPRLISAPAAANAKPSPQKPVEVIEIE